MELQDEVPVAVQETSEPFIGRWQGLVSTTNWEKGKIIWEWRWSLQEADTEATDYSDETWSQMVGGVTAQHVGRLRRVHERFGDTHAQYEGLFWSHFHAALDWEDAEIVARGGVAENVVDFTNAPRTGRNPRHDQLTKLMKSTSSMAQWRTVAALVAANATADVDSDPLTESVERVKGSEPQESRPKSGVPIGRRRQRSGR